MLKCSTCHAEQDSGKFCGVCGGELVEVETNHEAEVEVQTEIQDEQVATTQSAIEQPIATPSAPEQVSQTNDFDIQAELSQYGSFLLNLLKNPTQALRLNENNFVYGIINLSLFIITFALSIYFLLNTIFKNTIGLFANLGMFGGVFETATGMPSSLPFGSIVFQTGFRGILFLAIAFIATFVFSKLVTNHLTFKELLAQYGGILTPLLAANVLAILFSLIGSASLAFSFIAISFILTIIIIPALIVFEKGANSTTPTQKVYSSFATSVIALFGSYLIIKNGLANIFGDLPNIIDFFDYF